ncbi:aconitase X catalytic domain-containing protein [Desulfovibrio sp. OttesenSCG-928-C06]|nr:aconitase X catalytic domain-containing protein [Desulfovibrio sp. OttesenSCG-928-C06]
MHLTDEEKDMLSGKRGEGVRKAMEVVVKFGELYGANRLLKVKNAHIDAAAYTTIYDAGTEFVEFLVQNGAKVAVPTTINPGSRDIEHWRVMDLSPEFAAKSDRLEKAYMALGVSPTWTCAPYQCTSIPTFGEHISWSESNAVNYVNSVLGARTNRLPDLVDVCCAVVGRVPEYGLHLTENRAGQILFDLQGFGPEWFHDYVDYAVLGYLVGEIAIQRVPVINGLPESTTKDQLKTFSAAAASGGSTALFHAVGHTPEARTIEEAFQSKTGYERITVTPEKMNEVKNRLTTAAHGKVDMVMLGCPHSSYAEVLEVRDLLAGRKVAKGTKFWIQTSRTVYELASRSDLRKNLEAQGVTFIKDTCIMVSDTEKDWGFKAVVTNSGKVAQYVPSLAGGMVALMSTAECIEAAVKGEW